MHSLQNIKNTYSLFNACSITSQKEFEVNFHAGHVEEMHDHAYNKMIKIFIEHVA